MAEKYNLDDLAETIAQRVAQLKPIYDKKRAEHARLAEAHRRIREAPADRTAAAEFLTAVVDRYCDLHETDLRSRLQPERINEPYSTGNMIESWSAGLKSRIEPDTWLVIPLLREVLRRGAFELAERWPWPDTEVVSSGREKILADLSESMTALGEEIQRLEGEAQKVGMTLA